MDLGASRLWRISRPISSVGRSRKFLLAKRFSWSSTQSQDVFHSQKEDPSTAAFLNSYRSPPSIPQTLTEKIFQRHALDLPKGKVVRSGDFITLSPHRCMTHDNSYPVSRKFFEMGATKIHDPKQIVMTLDHDVQNRSEPNLKKYRQIEAFAKQQGVDFYPAGHGIGHQIMIEEGYAWPGTVAVASDSHSNMYGGIGALGTPVVRTGASDIWATGSTWFKIPPVAKVAFMGVLPEGTTGKDVIVALCGFFNKDEVLNHAIEFVGSKETMESLPIDYRLAIANMSTEWSALSGLFPIDAMLIDWLRFKATEASMFRGGQLESGTTSIRFNHKRIDILSKDRLFADKGARYAKSLFFDLSTVSPVVSGPNSVKVVTPVHELEAQNIKIDKAYLVSCTNTRASDIASAAKVFREAAAAGQPPQVADGVTFYIAAASAAEQLRAEQEGDWQVLLDAGAIPLPSGCAQCIGLGEGTLEPGEVGISASNRNFKGRMGSTEAKAYLASPEVVASSAQHGYIRGPGWYKRPAHYHGLIGGEGDGIERRIIGVEEALEKVIAQADALVGLSEQDGQGKGDSVSPQAESEIVAGFPEKVEGEIVFCDADNINTDGIYPGKYTYQDNVSTSQMADVCMQNYDPEFRSIVRGGDILVSGFNFGTGSSREQAATAILAKNIPLVVAGSFGNIFATNSINNALMGLEIPELIVRLRETFSAPTKQSSVDGKPITEPELNKQSLDSPPPAPLNTPETDTVLTRRTGWRMVWDVRRSTVDIAEGDGGKRWTVKVPEIPPNVQRIIAGGGLVKTRQAMFANRH